MKRPSYREVAEYIVEQGSCAKIHCTICPFAVWTDVQTFRTCEAHSTEDRHSAILQQAKEYLAKPKKPKEKITKRLVESILTAGGEDLTEWKGVAVYAFPTNHTPSTQPVIIDEYGAEYLVGYFPLEKS